jgi:hypothetical protein
MSPGATLAPLDGTGVDGPDAPPTTCAQAGTAIAFADNAQATAIALRYFI